MKFKGINPVEVYVDKGVLALAVATAAYFAYANLVLTPITVPGKTAPVTPENVENQVSAAVDKIAKKLDDGKLKAAVAAINVPDYVSQYKFLQSQPLSKELLAQLPLISPRHLAPGDSRNQKTNESIPVFVVPTLPPPANVDSIASSKVIIRPAAAGAAPAPAAPQPAGAAPAAPAVETVDLDSVQIFADRDPNLDSIIKTAFTTPQGLTPGVNRVVYKDFEVRRLTKDPSGNWPDPSVDANWTTIPPLPITQLPTIPGNGNFDNVDIRDVPPVLAALDNAVGNILNPAFYEIQTAPAPVAPPTVPANPKKPTPPNQHVFGVGPIGAGGPGGPGNPNGPGGLIGAINQVGQPPRPLPPVPMPAPNPDNPGQPGAPAAPAMLANKVWKYDIAVLPDQEYRYQCRWVIYNPGFNNRDPKVLPYALNPPTELSHPWLYSPWSATSKTAHIDANEYFFIAPSIARVTKPEIVIYHRVNGNWYRASDKFDPGAAIAAAPAKIRGKEVTFETGYTLVDVRQTPDNMVIVLLTPGGQLVERDANSDSKDPQRQILEDKSRATARGISVTSLP